MVRGTQIEVLPDVDFRMIRAESLGKKFVA